MEVSDLISRICRVDTNVDFSSTSQQVKKRHLKIITKKSGINFPRLRESKACSLKHELNTLR